MKPNAKFLHADCHVCVAAEQQLANAIDPARYDAEVVHPCEAKSRIAKAESEGVQSVPASVIGGQPFRGNFGVADADPK